MLDQKTNDPQDSKANTAVMHGRLPIVHKGATLLGMHAGYTLFMQDCRDLQVAITGREPCGKFHALVPDAAINQDFNSETVVMRAWR